MERTHIKIYEIKHSYLREPEYIFADNIEDAIYKFNNFYKDDFDIRYQGSIESINLIHNIEVIS